MATRIPSPSGSGRTPAPRPLPCDPGRTGRRGVRGQHHPNSGGRAGTSGRKRPLHRVMEAARGDILFERDADIPIPPGQPDKAHDAPGHLQGDRGGTPLPGRPGNDPSGRLRPALQLQPHVPPALHEGSRPRADAGPGRGIRQRRRPRPGPYRLGRRRGLRGPHERGGRRARPGTNPLRGALRTFRVQYGPRRGRWPYSPFAISRTTQNPCRTCIPSAGWSFRRSEYMPPGVPPPKGRMVQYNNNKLVTEL